MYGQAREQTETRETEEEGDREKSETVSRKGRKGCIVKNVRAKSVAK